MNHVTTGMDPHVALELKSLLQYQQSHPTGNDLDARVQEAVKKSTTTSLVIHRKLQWELCMRTLVLELAVSAMLLGQT